MWVVSLPVWGAEYVDKFVRGGLPSIKAADALNANRYMVYTDHTEALAAAMFGMDVEFKPVPPVDGDKYDRMSEAHRDTLRCAADGDYVALLGADMLLSREVFSACEKRFADGYSAVVAAATRTLSIQPPPPMSSRELLRWAMDHAHPLVKGCFYGAQGNCPWAVYFQNGENITLRGFHLHPVAVVKNRPLEYKGSLDQDLLEHFQPREIQVVTDPDELALAEMSPPAMKFYVPNFTINEEMIARWGTVFATEVHWWLSTHRIIICGNGDTEDDAVWKKVMTSPWRAMVRAKYGDKARRHHRFELGRV